MNLPYLLLLLTVTSCFVIRKKILTLSLIVTSLLMAQLYGIINYYGLLLIVAFYGITYFCFEKNNTNKILNTLLQTIMLLATAGFVLHMFPGIHNTLSINKQAISSISMPFSMYLNFDKTMAAIILFFNSPLYKGERFLTVRATLQTIVILLACTVSLMAIGLSIGYVKPDYKIPNILLIWFINNLFFVCFSEEVIFRGIIQNKLKTILPNQTHFYMHIILASLVFGLAYFKGGPILCALAAVAGLFYGFTYEKTGRIFCAMMVHFGLNLIHLLFFTYPVAASMMP